MTEEEYISALRAGWPRDGTTSADTMMLIDEAVRQFPCSAKLCCMRGNLIELGSENSPYSLDEALACYHKAIEIDPKFAEAWEDAGHFYNAVLDDELAAKEYFNEATRLKSLHVS